MVKAEAKDHGYLNILVILDIEPTSFSNLNMMVFDWKSKILRASPLFSHQVVAKRRKDRSDKTRGGTRWRVGPRKRTVGYVEEADRAQRGQSGALRRCSRPGVRNAGLGLPVPLQSIE